MLYSLVLYSLSPSELYCFFFCRKTDNGDLFKIGDLSLVLNTYTDEYRNVSNTDFDVPERIYARLEFENSENIPDTWYIQVTKTLGQLK